MLPFEPFEPVAPVSPLGIPKLNVAGAVTDTVALLPAESVSVVPTLTSVLDR